jgi:hypothetical protein
MHAVCHSMSTPLARPFAIGVAIGYFPLKPGLLHGKPFRAMAAEVDNAADPPYGS